jgi:hypothetical protein
VPGHNRRMHLQISASAPLPQCPPMLAVGPMPELA